MFGSWSQLVMFFGVYLVHCCNYGTPYFLGTILHVIDSFSCQTLPQVWLRHHTFCGCHSLPEVRCGEFGYEPNRPYTLHWTINSSCMQCNRIFLYHDVLNLHSKYETYKVTGWHREQNPFPKQGKGKLAHLFQPSSKQYASDLGSYFNSKYLYN